MTVEESTGVLKKVESEYKGHRSLLMRPRNLLSTMQRQDAIDRVILAVGFFLSSCVVSKRIGMGAVLAICIDIFLSIVRGELVKRNKGTR